MVANVLSRVEHFESQTVQKLSLSKQATYWSHSPTRLLGQELRDVIELWNGTVVHSNMLLEQFDVLVELFARIGDEELVKCVITELSHGFFLICIVH